MAKIPLAHLPDWPALLDWQMALAYSNMSEAELRRQVRQKTVVFVPIGPNGRLVARRTDLDAAILSVWSSAAGLPSEDFRFADE